MKHVWLFWGRSLVLFLGLMLCSPMASAQTRMSTEDAFQDLFITAGYSTAFGAALGTAFIGLSGKSPMSRLNYIAVGASLGFIAGSALGAHLLLSPTLGFDSGRVAFAPVVSDGGVGFAANFVAWVH